MLRLIKYSKHSAEMNMALDETLFGAYIGLPILRLYGWISPRATIGYFQKNDCNAVRRMTGGLTVNHKNDLSYCFIAGAETWKSIYSEPETFKRLHTALQKALAKTGFECSFLPSKQGAANNMCVETFYENDLIYKGKKVVGSCSRRRGTKILVQGSLHLQLDDIQKDVFQSAFASVIARSESDAAIQVVVKDLTDEELSQAAKLAKEKYSSNKWNLKY